MQRQQSEHQSRIEQLRAHLRNQGYRSVARSNYPPIVRRFLAYLDDHNRAVDTASPADVEGFLRQELRVYRRRHGRAPPSIPRWRRNRAAPVRLILHLVQGRWPPEVAPKPETPREVFHRTLLEGYDRWMDELRGLASVTRVQRIERANALLNGLGEHSEPNRLRELRVREIDTYLAHRAAGLRRKSIATTFGDLRVFVRYLHESGWTARDLSTSVTSPTLYAYEEIPSALPAEDVERVLAATHQDHTPAGRRDNAILTLLATYGLRAGEITALRLDDLDWKNDVLHVRHTKTGTSSTLPLTRGAGAALLSYLENGRPRCAIREVFLCLNAPYRAFPHGTALYDVIKRRLDSAGVTPLGKKGPHAFRHACAVRLLRAAVPLKEIGDILGHRSTLSTGVYLKLATEDLRAVALEIPAAVSP